jgi:TetR/AcrR family transcriptional repressor of nem operon
MAPRRRGSETSKTRVVLLDSAEQLMLDEGYAAVTYRKVAARAGVTVGLVHYYFPAIDDLFMTLLRRRMDRNHERLLRTLEERPEEPLRVVWEYNAEETSAALMAEFMGLANHRKAIMAEITEVTRRARKVQVDAIAARWAHYAATGKGQTPASLLFYVGMIPKMMQLEESMGLTEGHDQVMRQLEAFLDVVEPKPRSGRVKTRRRTD